ncbi:MAG: hypothetical protein Q8K96_07820 [Rubrivivax sp.]|nr:hypothetical protein [Rubrivivax sp.]
MSTWLKIVTVWILALAIPAQGLAAAAMVHCGASHERMHGGAAQAQAQAAESLHHEHAGASTPTDKFTDLAQYKCGACGSCCPAAAMPAFLLTVPESKPVAQWDALPLHGRIGFVTDGPDRPPRPVLA